VYAAHLPSRPAKVGPLGSLREQRLDLATMMTTDPPRIDMVLRGLPVGTVGVILGSGGVGKSMLVLYVAHAVATGSDDLGFLLDDAQNEIGRVVYLAGEDDGAILHHRLHAFAARFDADSRDEVVRSMNERIDIVPLVGSAPTLLDRASVLDEAAIAEVRAAAKGTRLLVIDPLRQFHAGDENDNGAMTTLIKALAQIAHEERCAIVLVHHVSKARAKNDDADAAMSRGAIAITDNARWVMALTKLSAKAHADHHLPGEEWRYLCERLVKANYAALGGVTILSRGAGGVLDPVEIVQHDLTREVGEGTSVGEEDAAVDQDLEDSLDPDTGESLVQRLPTLDEFARG